MAATSPEHYLGIGAIYRWEAENLREWVAFHRVVGVDRFFLYDNASEDEHLAALAPFIDDGSVTVHPWPVFPGQGSAYDHCLARHGHEARWIAFLDVDEFLFSPTVRPLSEVLRDYEQHPGVGVSRAWMGTSGHERRPAGLVLANFSSRLHLPEPNRTVKSIVDPSRVARRVNEHWFEYTDGSPTVDEHHQPLESWTRPGELTFDILRINHYFSKSEQEALAKFDRPQAGGGKLRPELRLRGLRKRNELYGRRDDVIQQYLPALEERLGAISRP
jgi:Glycosyltransferase family 92